MQVILFLILFTSLEGIWATECPSSEQGWLEKLDHFSSSLIPELGNNKLYRHGPKILPKEKYQRVISFWKSCDHKAPKSIKKIFKNIVEHSQYMVMTQSDGHSGFSISDEDYLINSLSINPLFASIPKIFFKNNYLPSNWKKIIQDCKVSSINKTCKVIQNWRFIEFTSTLEDGSGNHKRVIIQIKNKNFIQYLLFFPEHQTHNKNKLVDIIALQTKDMETGKSLKKARPFFFERHKKGFAKDGGRCISCHSNGLREVFPMQGSYLSKDTFNSIRLFNNELRSFGKPDWQGIYNHKKLGPPIGNSCIKCHSDKGERSPLTIFTNPSLIRSKVHELEMPFPKLYALYFNFLKNIQENQNNELQGYINDFVSKSKALPNKDYRTKKQVQEIRKKIQKALLEKNEISYIEYLAARTIENSLSIHTDYKIKKIFEDHKKEMKNWLMGMSIK